MKNVDHSISILFTKGMTASAEDPFDVKVFESDKQIEAIAIEYFSEDPKKAIAEMKPQTKNTEETQTSLFEEDQVIDFLTKMFNEEDKIANLPQPVLPVA